MLATPLYDSTGRVLAAPATIVKPSTCVIVYQPFLRHDGLMSWYVLVHQRRDNGHWGFLGGAQEIGESIAACAVREVREESGLDVALDRLCAVDSDPEMGAVCTYPDGNIIHYTCLVFSARPAVSPAMSLDPLPTLRVSEESLDVRWSPMECLPVPFLANHRWRLAQANQINKAPTVR